MKRLAPADPEARHTDLVTGNIAKLKALFPELITEGVNGAAVNVDALKRLVGDATVTDCDERYGLNWPGKRQAQQLALTPSTGTLRPCPEDSVNWDTTQNLMIEGDNLEVLKLLQRSYAGKVKLIYIDPPYNTGKNFVYQDNFQANVKDYLKITGQAKGGRGASGNAEVNGRLHANWLNMMYPRLRLARELLRDDGILAVSIDQHEVANLWGMLVDIFGEENFINTMVWVNNLRGRQLLARGAVLTHEYVMVWARSYNAIKKFMVQVEWAKAHMPSAYKGLSYEVLSDARGEFVLKNQLYNSNSAFNEATHPSLVFNIHYNPETGEVRTTDVNDARRFAGFHLIRPHRNNNGTHKFHAWRWSRSKVERDKDELAFIRVGDEVRIFTKVREFTTTALKDIITDIATSDGTRDVKALLGSCPFTHPKPLALMQLLIQATTAGDDGAIVMDFFAGSGTTGHAVMAQNVADGGNRRYILVQLPEPLDPENKEQRAAAEFCDKLGRPRTIAELTKERLRRAAKRIKDENPQFAGDLGFRAFKLDTSNGRA